MRKRDFRQRFQGLAFPIPELGCWFWTGHRMANGYGQFSYKLKPILAHRAAWIAHRDEHLSRDICVLHTCDNRWCVNPDHLFLGTYQDNSDDKCRKGRQMWGEKNWNSKLTCAQIKAIRADTRLQRIIGEEHGIPQNAVSLIKSRKIWANVL
jgi:hypothetical protein